MFILLSGRRAPVLNPELMCQGLECGHLALELDNPGMSLDYLSFVCRQFSRENCKGFGSPLVSFDPIPCQGFEAIRLTLSCAAWGQGT